jgi:hypothetical protein
MCLNVIKCRDVIASFSWFKYVHKMRVQKKRSYLPNRRHFVLRTEFRKICYNNNNNAGGTISKSLRQYLSNMPGKHEIKELQKTAILGNAHILQKVLMQTYKTFHGRNNTTCNTNGNYRTAATLHTLDTWFVPGT